MEEITKHINDTNASYRHVGAGDAKNTDLFLDNEHYDLFRDCGEQITVRFEKTNLTQAILFIASILPRKFDQSANHYIVKYSDEFVFDQLAILDTLFKEDGVSINTFTQIWNARKDVPKKNGEIDNRFYFNNLLREVEFKDHNGNTQTTKFTIRNYFAGGFSNLNIKKASDGIFDIKIDNITEPYNDSKEDGFEEAATPLTESHDNFSRQQIYYGAPGTGKSHKIKEQLEGVSKENIFRTTFHPDSDYSTFVGAYKPTRGSRPLYGLNGGLTVRLNDGKDLSEDIITYKFMPQAFLNAYMQAYKKPDENVYLIIEEINRGNCAQIFGDLFQLLDRDENGVSEYTIKADTDLKSFLEEELGKDSDAIKDGELCLPQNLYIYATMNTSDQSLFPIDSAFKRRWDWEYEPIKYKNISWMVDIQGDKYSWVSFQKEINKKIFDATSSEDKMLGDYFVNPNDGIITEKMLLNKILFYLWNDVCKDGEGDIFKTGDTEDVSFSELYDANGKQKLVAMMDYLGVSKFKDNEEDVEEYDDPDGENSGTGKDRTKYTINGIGEYAKKNLAAELVKLYVEQNPYMSASEVVDKWKSLGRFVSHFIETQAEYDMRTDKEPRIRTIQCGNEIIYVSTNGWGGQGVMGSLISAIPENWNLRVEKVQ